jgi:hypothetical protein
MRVGLGTVVGVIAAAGFAASCGGSDESIFGSGAGAGGGSGGSGRGTSHGDSIDGVRPLADI